MSTQQVIEHHLETLQAGDLDGIMEDYTEDSVLVVAGAAIKGLDGLRTVFGRAVETTFKPGASTFTLDAIQVEGECGLITWHLESEAGSVPFGTDTFVVRDGKIAIQTAAMKSS